MTSDILTEIARRKILPETGLLSLDRKIARLARAMRFTSIKISKKEMRHLPDPHYFMAGSVQVGVQPREDGTMSIYTLNR